MRTLWKITKSYLLCAIALVACNDSTDGPVSSSGVQQMSVKVDTNEQGHTVEQENVAHRYKMDNTPGSIKWLYVISPMSGDVILASSVQGKVTSSGKRLTPKTVNGGGNDATYTIPVFVSGQRRYTTEVIQDDGTYGDSGEYLYWWDARDQYHQQYVTAGVMVHISDKPMHWPKVILNMDESPVERR